MPKITVFSVVTCPYCKMLKDYLSQRGFEFTERLVDQDDEAREEMIESSGGFMGVPFTVVARDDGTKEMVIGFDKKRIDTLLGIKNWE